ncbi:MAG: AAA family ATPase [Acidobacteria bacterium]|nr:AAA family ATPase [Acidobacteriota bacterium]
MQTAVEQIRTALTSAYPVIVLVGPEESRLEALVTRFANAARPEPLPVVSWNCADGFTGSGPDETANDPDPLDALQWVADKGGRGLYIFKDLDSYFDNPRLVRRLRDTAIKIRNTGKFLFLMAPATELPTTLKPLSYIVVSLFPDETELRTTVATFLKPRNASTDVLNRLVTALKGMSLIEVEHLMTRLLAHYQSFDEDFFNEVLAEKEQVTRKEGILEFVPPAEGINDIGGLDQLKTWVQERSDLFTPEAREAGLPIPKGLLLMGMSGCGKSLAVKVIAQEWKLPLFRLDMNLVFAGVHGSPEWVFHRALQAVEAIAPAVLWIDEIEMGVAGYHEGQTGALTRIFSSFLTWMQEHRAEVFVAATANRINLLPAEIIRKGRFDQVFFVDLPNQEERKAILEIHLRRQGVNPANYDLILLSSATRGWNGAEIEQAVISARITAHAKNSHPTQSDLLRTFGKIIPLSKTMSEQLKAIRSWAKTRAVPATTPEKLDL